MLELNNVSIVCIDTADAMRALKALDDSCANISFKECMLFTSRQDFDVLQFRNIIDKIRIVYIEKLDKVGYSEFVVKKLVDYVNGDFCLIVQHDGFVVDHTIWRDDFLGVDYVGAPWPSEWGYMNRVGNGGFSLRSKKLLEFCALAFKDFDFRAELPIGVLRDFYNEDFLICVVFYEKLLELGIRFADVELASWFSSEYPVPEMKHRTFGVHDVWFR